METIKTFWANTKAWFNNSMTIAYARFQVVIGVVLGVFSNIDWTTVMTWDWSMPKKNLWISFGLVLNGLITEILRRRTLPTA